MEIRVIQNVKIQSIMRNLTAVLMTTVEWWIKVSKSSNYGKLNKISQPNLKQPKNERFSLKIIK